MLRGSILSLNSSINSGDAGSYLRNCIAACKNRPSMDDEDPHKDVVFERLNALRLAKEEEEDDTRRLSESSGDCDDDDDDDIGTICEPMTTTERKEHREREAARLAMAEKGVAATSGATPAATPAATATPDDPHRVENMKKIAKAAKEMNDVIDQILNNNIQFEPPPRDLHYHAASQQKLSRKLSRISTLSNGNDDDDDDDDDDEKSTSSSISTAHNLVDDIIRLKLLVANQQATIDSFELTNRRLKYFEARNKELEMELMEARGVGREGHNHQATEWNGGVNQEEGRLRRMPSMRRQASVMRSMPPNPTPLHSGPSSNPMRRSMPPLRKMHSDRSLRSSYSRVTVPATAAILPPQSTVVDRQRKELEWTVDALDRSECRRRRVEADSSRIRMQLNDSLERERTLRRETRELEERNGELMRESSELRAQLGNFNSGRVSGSSKGSSSLAAPLKVGEVSFNQSARNSTGRTSEDTMTTWSSTEESTNNVDVSGVWKSMPNMDSSGGWT